MVVGEEHHIHFGKVFHAHVLGVGEALWTGEREGARAFTEHRIGEEGHAVELDQQRRVPEPGQREGIVGHTFPRCTIERHCGDHLFRLPAFRPAREGPHHLRHRGEGHVHVGGHQVVQFAFAVVRQCTDALKPFAGGIATDPLRKAEVDHEHQYHQGDHSQEGQ